jgi:hypothetical protein
VIDLLGGRARNDKLIQFGRRGRQHFVTFPLVCESVGFLKNFLAEIMEQES